MKLQVIKAHSLPRLSWVAETPLGAGNAKVTAGDWVEVAANAVVEGAWDGEYSAMGFDRSGCMFGSGVRQRGHALVFVPSTSTTDALFWRCGQGTLVVSNSLPLLLAFTGDALRGDFDYAKTNESIMDGISNYQREIRTLRGTVRRLLHRNLHVEGERVEERDKPWPPEFRTFDAYRDYLKAQCVSILDNARDPGRARPMAVWSTQSRGYDSTAMNAIARLGRLDRVFTVAQGKAKGYFADEDEGREANDDGSEICKALGLPCAVIDRRSVLRDSRREQYYYAAVHDVADFNLDQICDFIEAPTLLITGCLGELWYPRRYSDERPGIVDSNLRRVDLGNHGMTEVRLHAGYVQFAFPFMGARRREQILALTESPAMDPWRLGTSYDRPIPRRIAEDAGVPRELFGQRKMASLLEYPAPLVPLGSALREEYFRFLRQSGLVSGLGIALLPLARRWNGMVATIAPDRHRWLFLVNRALTRLPERIRRLPMLYLRLGSSLYVFCVNRVVNQYADALRKSRLCAGACVGKSVTTSSSRSAPR